MRALESRISSLDLGLGPNADSPEARQTLEHALSRNGKNKIAIPRSDDDDPVRVKFFKDLAMKRAAKQVTQ